ncbi:MAG: hypothetical protein UZ22_OP11002000511 [Microgenomates bacterium OLB23]|nr:MAG: hypothetical protein UZ22_OP11002000511 [Microgenomates bacterium OLB23]
MNNKEQLIPLLLTVVIFVGLTLITSVFVRFLNLFTLNDIVHVIRPTDVLVGLTIYLKTSVDFAIFIGNLMKQYPGWRNRIAIELGTAMGNALGTLIILGIWNFFRNVEWLLALMIFIAGLVLLELATDSFDHTLETGIKEPFAKITKLLLRGMQAISRLYKPYLGFLIPHMKVTKQEKGTITLKKLFVFSFSIPFVLGLDDFAGYVPLFNIVNVLGFSVGVYLGHMLLNIFLFLSPKKTTEVVGNAYIALIGGLAFVGLALWGFYEAAHLLF